MVRAGAGRQEGSGCTTPSTTTCVTTDSCAWCGAAISAGVNQPSVLDQHHDEGNDASNDGTHQEDRQDHHQQEQAKQEASIRPGSFPAGLGALQVAHQQGCVLGVGLVDHVEDVAEKGDDAHYHVQALVGHHAQDQALGEVVFEGDGHQVGPHAGPHHITWQGGIQGAMVMGQHMCLVMPSAGSRTV